MNRIFVICVDYATGKYAAFDHKAPDDRKAFGYSREEAIYSLLRRYPSVFALDIVSIDLEEVGSK